MWGWGRGVGDVACAGPSRRFPVGDSCISECTGSPTGDGRATRSLGPSLASWRVTVRTKRRQESCRPKSATHAGMNGTSPEIPNTVDADPYATTGKAPATARSGQSGPASTGASAVGMQGREARGTREIPPSARPSGRGRRRKAIPSADVRVLGSRIGPYYRGSGVMPVEGRGRRISASSGWRTAGTQRPSPVSPSLRRQPAMGRLV